MGKLITENSKNFIKDNYPEVSIQETDIEIIFEGRFIINARKENFEIHEAPLLRIIMNKDYPNILPVFGSAAFALTKNTTMYFKMVLYVFQLYLI